MSKSLLDRVMSGDSVHNFTKDIIREGLTKDPLDAVRDCELALRCLKEHMEEVFNDR